ncbi:universal stress protein [Paenibacillus wulumuqiensis]|uniref:universal stress protein n=1 Tax=Paenibacillus wulumuqiensis TaxID=1567107 RepID=UPI0006195E40|nr:universal stress protein [Paenibacillus wulumuqiensis]
MNEEKIMVGVYYGPNGERLIRRGIRLAHLLQSPLYVITVLNEPISELDMQQENYLNSWKKMTEEAGGTFIIKVDENDEPAAVIADVARQQQITQLIIGQSAQSRWQEITRGSIVNDLLEELGAVDIHIVAVQRMKARLEETHEDGVEVDVIRTPSGYQIRYETDQPIVTQGVFFKDQHTDFDNGLLKLRMNDEYRYLKVFKGRVIDLLEEEIQHTGS